LVCTATEHGEEYAQHFEDIYRSFRKYFTQRGFELPAPEFPLIAVVFAGEREFMAQCRKDEVKWIPGLLGYYSRSTNRICLFEPDGEFVRVDPGPWKTPFTAALAPHTAGGLALPQPAAAGGWG